MDLILIYIPCANSSEAKKIAKALLEERLIACANISAIQSLYIWDSNLVDEKETLLLVKSSKSLYPKIAELIKQIHSYSCPCIMSIDINLCNQEYLDWLKASIKQI